jgi:hypothetical protein
MQAPIKRVLPTPVAIEKAKDGKSRSNPVQPGTGLSEKYSIEKQEVKGATLKMGYDLETSGCVLSASDFIEEMNACFV